MLQIPLIDFPKPWLFFNVIMTLSLTYIVVAFIRKWRGWMRGMPDVPMEPANHQRTIRIWIAEVLLQKQLYALSFFRWFVHILIFYGFVGLLLLPIVVFILTLSGHSASIGMNLDALGYAVRKIWADCFGLMLLFGLILAGIRRFVVRPEQQNNNQMDVMLLSLLFLITITGFILEGLRLTLMPADVARYSVIGQFFIPSAMMGSTNIKTWLTACWTIHAVLVASLILYLPHSKLMHSLFAPVVIGINAVEEQGRKDIYWPEMKKYRPTGSPRD